MSDESAKKRFRIITRSQLIREIQAKNPGLKKELNKAKPYLRDTGCVKCDFLPPNEMCLDCQIKQVDADVSRAMNRLEELKRKKQEQYGTQNNQKP